MQFKYEERKTEVSSSVISPISSEWKESWKQSEKIITVSSCNIHLLTCLAIVMLVNQNKYIR